MRAVRRRRQPEVRLARRPLPRLRAAERPRRPPAAVLRRLLLRRLPGAALRPHRPGLPAQGQRVTDPDARGRARHRRQPRPRLRARPRPRRPRRPGDRLARTVGGLEELADAIEAAGGPTPTLVPLSLTDDGGLQRLCLAIHERWGRLDLARPLRRPRRRRSRPPPHIADKDFDPSVEVNLRGTARLIVMLQPLLAAAPAGRFVYVADNRAGQPFFGSYGASQGRRRGAGPLLGRRDRPHRPARPPLPPEPDADRAPRPLLSRRGHRPPRPLRHRSRPPPRPHPRSRARRLTLASPWPWAAPGVRGGWASTRGRPAARRADRRPGGDGGTNRSGLGAPPSAERGRALDVEPRRTLRHRLGQPTGMTNSSRSLGHRHRVARPQPPDRPALPGDARLGQHPRATKRSARVNPAPRRPEARPPRGAPRPARTAGTSRCRPAAALLRRRARRQPKAEQQRARRA